MNQLEEMLAAFAKGSMVVVFDDEDRENEADIVVAIDHVTPEKVNFIAKYAKGLICAPLTYEMARKKGFPLMPANKEDKHATAFTISVDSRRASTGISPAERCQTAKDLLDPTLTLADFVTPGHLFPLIARNNGLLERRGHTEAAVSLCQWAGLNPGALICEMIHDDGTMFTAAQAREFATSHGLGFCTIGELVEYQKLRFPNVTKVSTARLPTDHGVFDISVYREIGTNKEHVFLSMGDFVNGPVRVHSECLTGDVFGSRKCDCGSQLQNAMHTIAASGSGAIVYLRQEGRDIGLAEKIKAYALQQAGHDTVDANLLLGHGADERDFHQAAWILKLEGFRNVELLTNNPDKIACLEKHGLRVSHKACEVPALAENAEYLFTKKKRMGHLLRLAPVFRKDC